MFRKPRIQAKTAEQVLAMRRAGLVVADTLRVAREAAVPGTTTAAVDRVAEEHIRAHGAVPSFKGYHGFPASLCISVNDEVVHGIPGERELREGDLVSIDCGAVLDGWHGDAAVSTIVGGRAAGQRADLALLDDTQASLWAGIAALRVGGRLYDVGDAIEESVEASADRRREAGMPVSYGILEDYVGHGIGRQMHMDPHVPNYAVTSRGPAVPPGATLAIEPMVTLGTIQTRTLDDDWTVVTVDGTRAAHWEHTVAVTEGGLWVLTAEDGGAAQLPAAGARYAPLG